MSNEFVIEKKYPTFTPMEVCSVCYQSRGRHERVARLIGAPEIAMFPFTGIVQKVEEMNFTYDLRCPRYAFRRPWW